MTLEMLSTKARNHFRNIISIQVLDATVWYFFHPQRDVERDISRVSDKLNDIFLRRTLYLRTHLTISFSVLYNSLTSPSWDNKDGICLLRNLDLIILFLRWFMFTKYVRTVSALNWDKSFTFSCSYPPSCSVIVVFRTCVLQSMTVPTIGLFDNLYTFLKY